MKDEELISICSNCKKVFNEGVWKEMPIEGQENLTHGMCPDCIELLYAKYGIKVIQN